MEALYQGGLQIASRAWALRQSRYQCDSPMRAAAWASRLDRAVVFQLEASVAAADRVRASRARAEFHLSDHSLRPFTQAVNLRVRRGFQRFVCRAVEPDRAVYMVGRMEERLQGRPLPARMRRRSERAVSMRQQLAPLVQPSVWASGLRTLWNGWVTARRRLAGQWPARVEYSDADRRWTALSITRPARPSPTLRGAGLGSREPRLQRLD